MKKTLFVYGLTAVSLLTFHFSKIPELTIAAFIVTIICAGYLANRLDKEIV